MGLDAFVHCRCWQDGLAPPPPALEGLVGFDEEGWLSLLPPHDEDDDAYAAFRGWRQSCPHREMRAADEWVSNWGGYRRFQAALGDVGWQHFPTLRAELPNANGGQMPAAAAARALAELDHFARHATLDDEVVLRDEATGAVVLEYIAAYRGVTLLGPGYRAGIDPDGFFVLDPDTDPPATLFRSLDFRQRVLDDRRVELADGALVTVIDMPPVGGGSGQPPPERLRIDTRPRGPADFAGIVGALRAVCLASVETGNPVAWT